MTRRRAVRVTALVAVAVVVAAVLVVGGGALVLVRRPLPDRGGDVKLPGMTGTATVYRDARGVPQVYASNPQDLFRVQGYVQAEDRFFEMDLRRHVTAGRLSELVGRNDDALRADALIRTMGWRDVAEQELAKLPATTRGYLQAYSDGVNAYIKDRSPSELSVSYTVLARANDLEPIEAWTPLDSVSWLKAMAWDLRSNYDEELARARAVSTVRDIKRVNQLFPAYDYAQHSPIIQTAGSAGTSSGTAQLSSSLANPALAGPTLASHPPTSPAEPADTSEWKTSSLEDAGVQRAFAAADAAVDAIPDLLGANSDGIGSNSWVVGGALTSTGLPLLANDPHLATSMPGVWVQVGLHCTTVTTSCPFDVSGYTFAGLPGVVIGHNDRIAWGMTNLAPDVTDFYLEKVTGNSVEYDGKLEPMSVHQEQIKVAGGDPVTITVRRTRHGPLLSDVLTSLGDAGRSAPVPGEDDDRNTDYAVSLAWTALTPGTSMEGLFAVDVAHDFTSFRAAVLKLQAPGQNFVYGDVDGHIGYQSTGTVPVRGPGRASSTVPVDGTWPHPGWDSAYDWTGTVPAKNMPWEEDPPQNYIVAANQAVTGPDGTPVLTKDWDYGYRSQRIEDLLTTAAKRSPGGLTVADMQAVQGDTRNGIAAVLVPLLLKIKVTDPFYREAVDLLKGWDYTQPTDSAAAAYFNVVWTNILDLAFADELPEGFRPDGGDRWFAVVSSLLDNPRNQWWDDRKTPDVTETRDEVLRRSLVEARLELTATLGKEPKRWQWGRLHRLELKQTPLGADGTPGLLQKLVNRGPYEAPGGSSIVDAFAWDASSGTFDVVAAPSMRMVVDLDNFDHSRWVNQTGESGHPGDKHYDDQIETWLANKDFAWPASQQAVQEASREEQRFSKG
ncbi:penicillin acylase family protein [Spongisporangium articulatum]|uniref:Penicillin acylase family protein n=1 Tax=Spongisporangium articulatum TaxID=3362603 RepID=A0ABW8AQY8_9ACTN